ncbi:MAG: glycosyltransferase family 39 protein [Candidatus Dojkabacteria bacterium]
MLKKIRNKQNIILYILLAIFLLFTLYLASTVKMGISSDSWYHLRVSQEYSKTLGIPVNTPDTYKWRDITNIPYLYFWINGRILNLNSATFNFNEVILLRVINIFFALGTVIATYLLSKECIKNRWAQLIPVLLLVNTLMFLFLSSSINYDNLSNMLASFAILFFVKSIKQKDTLKYPILTILMLSIACLTKYTILPLAFILVILLLIDMFRTKRVFNMKDRSLLLLLPTIFFLLLNLLLYGGNLVNHGELDPDCSKTLTYEQCLENGVFRRDNELMPAEEVNLIEMITTGQRLDPIRYTGIWIWEMTKRVIGIMGDSSFFHSDSVVSLFTALLGISLIVGVVNWKKYSVEIKYMASLTLFYLLILLIVQNYDMYLKRGYEVLALQGRYMFPVISSFYVLISVFWLNIKNKYFKIGIISISLILLTLLSIPYFLLNVDSSWFGTITY